MKIVINKEEKMIAINKHVDDLPGFSRARRITPVQRAGTPSVIKEKKKKKKTCWWFYLVNFYVDDFLFLIFFMNTLIMDKAEDINRILKISCMDYFYIWKRLN